MAQLVEVPKTQEETAQEHVPQRRNFFRKYPRAKYVIALVVAALHTQENPQ